MTDLRQLVMEQSIEDTTEALLLTHSASPRVRPITGGIGRGFWTLTFKEIRRFLKIWIQTIVSPLVMTILFYTVFAFASGRSAPSIGGVPFLHFLIPGLVMMSMAQAAFMNSSVSLILSKVQGHIVDLLMAPLSPLELTLGYAVSSVVRGLIVGVVSMGILYLLMPLHYHSVFYIFYYAIMGSLMMGLMGFITGVWGRDFDHLGAIQNFLIMPATFLSGTFFSSANLPKEWAWTCLYNPFFYMIDGFRYGVTGYADSSIAGGMAILLFVNMILFHIAYWMVARGTRLKS